MRRSTLGAAFAVLCAVASAQTAALVPSHDNTLFEDPNGALSNGAGPHFYVGRVGFSGGQLLRRGLLRFDVASVVPAGHAVIAAELHLQCSQASGGSVQVFCHRALAAWGEGTSDAGTPGGAGVQSEAGDATWTHTFYPNAFWSAPGGDYVSTFSAKAGVDTAGAYLWTGPGLVADVQSWLDAPATNYGWLLKTNELNPGEAKRFDSRENVGFEPVLVVTYAPAIPASVQNVGVGCSGTNPLPMSLVASGAPVLGDDGWGVDVVQGPPNGFAFLWLSFSTTNAPLALGGGCHVYLDLGGAQTFAALGLSPIGPLPLDAQGAFNFAPGLPPEPALAGFPLAVQAVAADAGAPSGFVLSDALAMILGV